MTVDVWGDHKMYRIIGISARDHECDERGSYSQSYNQRHMIKIDNVLNVISQYSTLFIIVHIIDFNE